jgi:L-methionine (R)-S-oxide reductase
MDVMIMQKSQTKEELISIISSLCNEEVTSFIHLNGILANVSAYLYHTLEDINWVGFYYRMEDDSLFLGPFQGEVACMILSKGKGVCQKAVEEEETVVVDDVHLFSTHIACDSRSQSEIVVPILVDNTVVAVIDIDSPHTSHFTPDLVQVLEKVGEILRALFTQSKEYLDII